jgi:hypothetical protein
MLGASSDQHGLFEIRNVPVGDYDLVASMVGYSPGITKIHLTDSATHKIVVRLKPRILQVDEIEIVAPYPTEWRSHLEKCRQLLFGNTPNASLCKILNPEILDFKVDNNGRFEVTASKPLQIENLALGYKISYVLETLSLEGNMLTMAGNPRFEKLIPGSETEKKKWEQNRLKAYNGSLRHFLVSLVTGRFKEEGFEIYEVRDLLGPNVTRKPPQDEILLPAAKPYERTLHFQHYLEVHYTHEDVDAGYNLLGRTGIRHQISWLLLNQNSVTIDTEGHIRTFMPTKTFGYWSWERMGEALPLEFKPGQVQAK